MLGLIEIDPALSRAISAAPELTAAATYAMAWFAPGRLAPALLRSLVLALLVEFLVIHASVLLTAMVDRSRRAAGRSLGSVAFLALLYLGFAGGFAVAFKSWMPLWVVGWLVASRLLTIWVDPRELGEEPQRQQALWAFSALFYILTLAATAILPIPELGVDGVARQRMELPGSGGWIDQPQKAFAMGLAYFGLVGWFEITDWKLARAR